MAEVAKRRRFQVRRERLQQFIHDRCAGSQAEFARAIGVAQSSVSRMLYPEGKSGAKNIGEDTIARISARYPDIPLGWFDTPVSGTNTRGSGKLYVVQRDDVSPELVSLSRRIMALDSHWKAAVDAIVAIAESAMHQGQGARKPKRRRRPP